MNSRKRRNLRFGITFAGVAAVVGLVIPTVASASAEADHSGSQAVLDQARTEHQVLGGVLAAGNESESWSLSSGTAKLGTETPIQPTDKVRIASNTKTFVAATLLQLVGEGKIDLDAPVEQYLPGVVQGNGYDGTKITVRQLLQHTSGIADYLGVNGGPLSPINQLKQHDPAELVRAGLQNAPVFAPGTDYGYSNTNYILAGMVIEKVTGTPVGDEVTNRIITPLGLNDTSYPKPGDKDLAGPHSRGYLGGQLGPVGGYLDVTSAEPSFFGAAGAIVSTADDMTTFVQALADGKVLASAELEQMRTPNAAGNPGYGLGLYKLPLSCGGEAWGHNGLVPGYHSIEMATDDGRHVAAALNGGWPMKADAVSLDKVADAALCEAAD